MRLIEAFEVINQERAALPQWNLFLACGFTPLHASIFFRAFAQKARPTRNVALRTGIFGDLAGNVEAAAQLKSAGEHGVDALGVAMEWQDLDARLGYRQLGGWKATQTADIVENVARSLLRLETAIAATAKQCPIALCPPTLPLPPFSHEPGWQAGPAEIAIRASLAASLERMAQVDRVRLVSIQHLDRQSPPGTRLDIKGDIATGFPYTLPHASAVGEALSHLIQPPPPKKGLITDLDDTLWLGILGDIGINGVAWDLDRKAHLHGLYQQFLTALASRGVLVGVVSKNDPALVQEVFAKRQDLLVDLAGLFPIEAGWGRKSEAVGRVLKAWNIAADSVVFVDDSPLELEEVRSTHPGIETFRFTPGNPAETWSMIEQMQDLFGKPQLREEDSLRLASLRNAVAFPAETTAGGPSEDDFLAKAEATITFDGKVAAGDGRALELINKTNQFNLNGRRIAEYEWAGFLQKPDAFLLTVSYQDKFGLLGKIAVIAGEVRGGTPLVTSWVMSCRAFARRIEHRCLEELFLRTGAAEIAFAYEKTPRNGPVADLFSRYAPGFEEHAEPRIALEAFKNSSPRLFHAVKRSAE